MDGADNRPSSSVEALRDYRTRAIYLLNALDATESDIESILINVQTLAKQSLKGFVSEKVNPVARDSGGVSEVNEVYPQIALNCYRLQKDINKMVYDLLRDEEPPETSINVTINPVNLEDVI